MFPRRRPQYPRLSPRWLAGATVTLAQALRARRLARGRGEAQADAEPAGAGRHAGRRVASGPGRRRIFPASACSTTGSMVGARLADPRLPTSATSRWDRSTARPRRRRSRPPCSARDALRKPGSAGKPVPHAQIKLENGEIWVKGSSRDAWVLGKRPGQERPFAGLTPEGWFKTGDPRARR